jgi:hypothetical protein
MVPIGQTFQETSDLRPAKSRVDGAFCADVFNVSVRVTEALRTKLEISGYPGLSD